MAALLLGGSVLLIQVRRNSLEAVRKTTFVSNVSHELKTPLTTIRMYGEMLGDGIVKDETKNLRCEPLPPRSSAPPSQPRRPPPRTR